MILHIPVEAISCHGATTYIVKQFGIVSVGKFFAVFGRVWGFFMGIILAAGLGGMGSVFGAPALGIGAGLLGLVFMVIAGGVIGFIGVSLLQSCTTSCSGQWEVLRWTWKPGPEPFRFFFKEKSDSRETTQNPYPEYVQFSR
jgi:hypothetical protein